MRSRHSAIFAAILFLTVFLASCRPPPESAGGAAALPTGIQGRLELQGDARVGTVPAAVYLLRSGSGVSGATVTVRGDMTHAGMTPVSATAGEREPGLYVAEEFAFTMGGDWLLSADVVLPDGESFTLALPVSVSGR